MSSITQSSCLKGSTLKTLNLKVDDLRGSLVSPCFLNLTFDKT